MRRGQKLGYTSRGEELWGGQRGGASRKDRLRRRRPSSRVIGCCALSSVASRNQQTRMGRKVTVATCALNQWALDFEGNFQRILKSESGVEGDRKKPKSPMIRVWHSRPAQERFIELGMGTDKRVMTWRW